MGKLYHSAGSMSLANAPTLITSSGQFNGAQPDCAKCAHTREDALLLPLTQDNAHAAGRSIETRRDAARLMPKALMLLLLPFEYLFAVCCLLLVLPLLM